jgi:hypothetical protein
MFEGVAGFRAQCRREVAEALTMVCRRPPPSLLT